jgi:hypothetical protein
VRSTIPGIPPTTRRSCGCSGPARRADQGPAGPRRGRPGGRHDRQGRVRSGLHEGRRQRHERLHQPRPHLLLHHRPVQQARTLGLDGERPAQRQRVSRVLFRAGRRPRGAAAADRQHTDGPLPGTVRRHVLGLVRLCVARDRLAERPQQLHLRAGPGLLEHLLPPRQPRWRRGGRLRSGGGEGLHHPLFLAARSGHEAGRRWSRWRSISSPSSG